MRLIPWRDADPLFALQRQMNRLFSDFSPVEEWQGAQTWAPVLDIEETDQNVIVRAELPGIDPKEVEIDVLGNILTLRGEKKEEKESKDKNWHRVERHYGAFTRSVQLPCPVNAEKAMAKAKDGVLTITLNKKEEAKARRIQVRSE
jgi:HSP20 family protein